MGDERGHRSHWQALPWSAPHGLACDGRRSCPPAGEGIHYVGWLACVTVRPEAAKQHLATDTHSPAEFRCNQIVRNVDAFHEAFGVQPGDALWLDPSERITIW